MTSIQVQEASNPDLPHLFTITSLAFQHTEPFWDLTFPSHDTPQGRSHGAHRFLLKRLSDPTIVYTKASINTPSSSSNDKIVGMARWHICEGEAPPEREYELPGGNPGYAGEEWEAYKRLSDAFMAKRNRAIRDSGGRIVVLDVLAVEPGFQGMGVGRRVVEWGVKRAGELGTEVVVESSVEGRGFYERCGFEGRGRVVVEAGVEGWGRQESVWMVWSGKGE
ncbi:hypothetical protein M409DRAFT_17988 [Zasmidium cellare ATCC 36951]|uniref:N-acetyltransferase domain-containing protein n=1 Tax=Zasmidium cellare ATCC 36951 TaxID=1080233 RepID=A0A6A6CYF4_ZASCE|nr:uncharacterized protein M409DRAFT_17988 [Zasmidium cellare ATCC 36951]KAF2171753.1 hypothetical protein M409DRAFT_17988 [Zasmidium cellare ATCC 36951]